MADMDLQALERQMNVAAGVEVLVLLEQTHLSIVR
jgi:hypothetical protein